MPIRVRCPKCNETAELPDAARGRKGVCNRCGSVVHIPAEIRKVCVFCHADVTNTAHIKDPEKNYVCETCWKGRNPDPPKLQETVAPAPAEEPAGDAAPTTTLDPGFAAADSEHPGFAQADAAAVASAGSVDRQYDDDGAAGAAAVAAAHDWPYDHRPSFGRLRPKPRRASRVSTLLALLALVVSLATAYTVWTRVPTRATAAAKTWEDAHRAQIHVLKGQAEVLVEMGHVREGLARYEELERLVKDKSIRDPALRDTLLAAWRDRDTTMSKDMLVQQVAEAAQKAASSSAPDAAVASAAETTITLIEDPATAAMARPTTRPAATTQRSTFDPN